MNNSIVENNEDGIETSRIGISLLTKNNLYNNMSYDINYGGQKDQNAENNYWGTTNRSEIMGNIYDYWDQITLGEVIFEPFAANAIYI